MGLALHIAEIMEVAGAGDLTCLQIITCEQLAGQRYPHADPSTALLVLQVKDRESATALGDILGRAYPKDHDLMVVDQGRATHLSVGELRDFTGWADDAAVWVPPLPTLSTMEALQDIVAQLRAPDGCPWDRDLTWDKLRASLLEETHELLAALDAGAPGKVQEELGDLLLQIALITQIASETDLFRLPDVIRTHIAKLIRRHPHVFGDVTVHDADEVLANWEAIKADERRENGEKRSPLSGVPKGLSALAQAQAFVDRISRIQHVAAPASPEEVISELPAGRALGEDEVGKLFFDLAVWAWSLGVDAESALRKRNVRYADNVDAGTANAR